MYKALLNNQVTIEGEVASKFELSHKVFGEGFYTTEVIVRRSSNYEDHIPIMVSERLVDVTQDYTGEYITVNGQFRSFNKYEENKTRLMLYVYAREIIFVEDELDYSKENSVILEGYICKRPVYRLTHLGREVADVLLAVNRPYGKSDYIPCIVWGRNAKYAYKLPVGEKILITGRIQSRIYNKKLSETEVEQRTAYEVSVSTIETSNGEVAM